MVTSGQTQARNCHFRIDGVCGVGTWPSLTLSRQDSAISAATASQQCDTKGTTIVGGTKSHLGHRPLNLC